MRDCSSCAPPPRRVAVLAQVVVLAAGPVLWMHILRLCGRQLLLELRRHAVAERVRFEPRPRACCGVDLVLERRLGEALEVVDVVLRPRADEDPDAVTLLM